MKKLCLVLAVFFFTACISRKDEGPLPNNYAVLAMGSMEVYVANPQRELLLGPTLVSIGVTNNFVIAFCGWETTERNGFANTVGYNILDTDSGQIVRKLSETEARSWIESKGLQFPILQSPSVLMTASR